MNQIAAMAGFSYLKRLIFLNDVLLLSVSAFGGPQMHMAMFLDRMVQKKKYLTEAELLELYSLCQMLPGPTSTQTITSMGYKFGGPRLAFFTLLVWLLPATILMTTFSFIYTMLDKETLRVFKYIQPLAVAFIITSAIQMVKIIGKGKLSIFLIIFAFTGAALLRHPVENYFKTPWIFPILLFLGGFISYWYHRDFPSTVSKEKLKIKWTYFIIFALIFILAAVMGKITQSKPIILFENTFRFGSMVFGGGNVLIPMMFEQFVKFQKYLTADEFITGIGLVQAVPGPVFSFSTFTTGLALKDLGTHWHLFGCIIGTVGIFLPGMLFIFFIYPIWDQLKQFSLIQRSLEGVIAASTGLVVAAAYLLFLPVGLNWVEPENFFYTNLAETNFMNWGNIAIIAVLSFFLYKTKIPTPVWVVLAMIAGIFF